MTRRYLYLIAGLIWGIPGIMLTVKGAKAYTAMPRQQLWWLALIPALVVAAILFIKTGLEPEQDRRI